MEGPEGYGILARLIMLCCIASGEQWSDLSFVYIARGETQFPHALYVLLGRVNIA